MMRNARRLATILTILLTCTVIADCSNQVRLEDSVNNTHKSSEAVPTGEMRFLRSTKLVKKIKIGWNLGNTMDAGEETAWGNPVTTRAMVEEVKKAGFNAIRIPITWEPHLGPHPDYKIEETWLNRVSELIDYATTNDMYVIINMHHERWHFPSFRNLEKAKAQLISVWAQIAERFRSMNEHLIFESMNEPRMFGTNFEWNGGNEEGRDCVNQLNATFVETVRATGGNNSERSLMIPTYAASADPMTWVDFVIPEDKNIIVSIHAYTPYNFALNGEGTANWSPDNEDDTRQIDELMKFIHGKFVSQGIPVIIGEFGARNKGNVQDRAMWAEYYIKKAAEKGIPCIWWDNGSAEGDGELFGLLNRRELTWYFPEVVDALMRGLQ